MDRKCEGALCNMMLPASELSRWCGMCRPAQLDIKGDERRVREAYAADAKVGAVERPIVRHGDVLATVFNELGTAFRRLQQLEAFEAKVTAAAKSPAAWLALREELGK